MPKGVSIIIFIILWVMIPLDSVFAYTYSGGTGEPNNPYLIATAEDMNEIGAHPNDWDKHFLLVNDINLADYTGTQFNIIGVSLTGGFNGIFDGNGHTIHNFSWIMPSPRGYIGLFGRAGVYCEIRNLGISDVNIHAEGGSDFVGALVGFNSGTVINCYSTGTIKGTANVGGLVGFNDGLIKSCYSDVILSGNSYGIGGLVGINYYGTVVDSHSTSYVSGKKYVGGLIGANENIITDCYSMGNVIGISSCYEVGGLVGSNSRIIQQCYSLANVSGMGERIGGLAGDNSFFGDISNSYSSGIVDGNSLVGGLLGINFNSNVTYCYSVANVSGIDNVGGLIGFSDSNSVTASFWNAEVNPDVNGVGNSDDPNVIGTTTAEMKKEKTFLDANWDFVEIWDIGENQTYPFLRTYLAGDINHDNIVNLIDLAILGRHWLQGI